MEKVALSTKKTLAAVVFKRVWASIKAVFEIVVLGVS